MAAYTFSKNLDYGGSAASGGGAVGDPQTVTNLRAGRGPSGFDVKHRFMANYLYELPFGKGKRWVNSGPADLGRGRLVPDRHHYLSDRPALHRDLTTGVNNGAPSWPNRIGSGKLDNPDRARGSTRRTSSAPPPNTYGNAGRGFSTARDRST